MYLKCDKLCQIPSKPFHQSRIPLRILGIIQVTENPIKSNK